MSAAWNGKEARRGFSSRTCRRSRLSGTWTSDFGLQNSEGISVCTEGSPGCGAFLLPSQETGTWPQGPSRLMRETDSTDSEVSGASWTELRASCCVEGRRLLVAAQGSGRASWKRETGLRLGPGQTHSAPCGSSLNPFLPLASPTPLSLPCLPPGRPSPDPLFSDPRPPGACPEATFSEKLP